MRITLFIDNEEKTFTVPFVSAMALRQALSLQKKANEQGMTVEVLDDFVEYIVNLFKNQFTLEDYYNGVPIEKFTEKTIGIIEEVIEKARGKQEQKDFLNEK